MGHHSVRGLPTSGMVTTKSVMPSSYLALHLQSQLITVLTVQKPSQLQGAVASAPTGLSELYPWRWLALAVLLLGLFMALLDQTIVNVALQTIGSSLHANEATLAWIISGYALAFGIALIPSGRIGDRFGRVADAVVDVALAKA